MKITIKKIRINKRLEMGMIIVGALVFLLSNTYFGWNREAQSNPERMWDLIWHILVYGSAFRWTVNMTVEQALNNITDIEVDKS
jgi:hypothetical protein|tara:strand:- start:2170 stop:2421 length:252 start_codon:yes stop_codon:yes gene_type:complete